MNLFFFLFFYLNLITVEMAFDEQFESDEAEGRKAHKL